MYHKDENPKVKNYGAEYIVVKGRNPIQQGNIQYSQGKYKTSAEAALLNRRQRNQN